MGAASHPSNLALEASRETGPSCEDTRQDGEGLFVAVPGVECAVGRPGNVVYPCENCSIHLM